MVFFPAGKNTPGLYDKYAKFRFSKAGFRKYFLTMHTYSKKHLMKIRIIFSSIIAVFIAASVKAQTTEFNLSAYTPPEYVYRSLDFSYYLSGSSNGDVTFRDGVKNGKNAINYFSTSLQSGYKQYSNSRRYQGSTGLNLYAGFSINKDNRFGAAYDNKHRQNGNSVKLSYNGQNRFYRNGKAFFEVDPDVGLIHQSIAYSDKNYQNDSLVNDSKTYKWEPSVNIKMPLLAGYGRIEDITDARHAVYILEGLRQTGSLKRGYNDADILSLAAGITKIRNKRFFDSRHQRIYELKTLDSLLQSYGLTGDKDAAYFTALNDEWLYSMNTYRYSGIRFSGGIDPQYSLYHYLKEITSNLAAVDDQKRWDESLYRYIGLKAGFKHEKPISLKWQSSLDCSIGYGIEYAMTSFKNLLPDPSGIRKSTQKQQRGNILIGYQAGFYPNSRTWLQAGIDAQVLYYGNGTTKPYATAESDLPHSLIFAGGPDVSLYYYISPRLRLTVNCGFDYYRKWVDSYNGEARSVDRSWDWGINSTVTYSLF